MRRALDYTIDTASGRFGMRIVDFAPEERRLVLTVELDDPGELPRAMQGFGVRFAKAVQRERDVGGPVLADRYAAAVVPEAPRVKKRRMRELAIRTNEVLQHLIDAETGWDHLDEEIHDIARRGPPVVRMGLLAGELFFRTWMGMTSFYTERDRRRNEWLSIYRRENIKALSMGRRAPYPWAPKK